MTKIRKVNADSLVDTLNAEAGDVKLGKYVLIDFGNGELQIKSNGEEVWYRPIPVAPISGGQIDGYDVEKTKSGWTIAAHHILEG